jgi:hypothetical protein
VTSRTPRRGLLDLAPAQPSPTRPSGSTPRDLRSPPRTQGGDREGLRGRLLATVQGALRAQRPLQGAKADRNRWSRRPSRRSSLSQTEPISTVSWTRSPTP